MSASSQLMAFTAGGNYRVVPSLLSGWRLSFESQSLTNALSTDNSENDSYYSPCHFRYCTQVDTASGLRMTTSASSPGRSEALIPSGVAVFKWFICKSINCYSCLCTAPKMTTCILCIWASGKELNANVISRSAFEQLSFTLLLQYLDSFQKKLFGHSSKVCKYT